MIARRDLLRHLAAHGCSLLREGSKHSVYVNASGEARTTVPRHRELPRTTARAICDQLGVPRI
jgi:predicted RNA binding protein YcfA (HicA-like mRNA interferase family)